MKKYSVIIVIVITISMISILGYNNYIPFVNRNQEQQDMLDLKREQLITRMNEISARLNSYEIDCELAEERLKNSEFELDSESSRTTSNPLAVLGVKVAPGSDYGSGSMTIDLEEYHQIKNEAETKCSLALSEQMRLQKLEYEYNKLSED